MYATIQDMLDRFGEIEITQLSDKAIPPTSVLDEGRVQRAIDDAESTINSYLQSRGKLPIDPVPDSVIKVTCDIARYNLYDDHPTETVESKHKDAMQWLRDFSMGKVTFGSNDNPPARVFKTAETESTTCWDGY